MSHMNTNHIVKPVLFENIHPVSVCVIGAGGTGSQVLDNLAKLHVTLQALGFQGLEVGVYDGDDVTEANAGRTQFSLSDIGLNKAEVLVSRINRFYGTHWSAKNTHFTALPDRQFNIYILCVDSFNARKMIYDLLSKYRNKQYQADYGKKQYVLDIGNSKSSGQIILGDVSDNRDERLITFIEQFPGLETRDIPQEPSCSLVEAIGKQSLYINRIMATYACQMLYEMFTEYEIDYRGIFINLKTMQVNKIRL